MRKIQIFLLKTFTVNFLLFLINHVDKESIKHLIAKNAMLVFAKAVQMDFI